MRNLENSCEVAIIGGGLSGLAACHLLQEQNVNTHVFEAADRFGGRIDSQREPASGKVIADLGPTWIWPPYQPTISRWLNNLKIKTSDQYETGLAVVERGNGLPTERHFLPGQHGMVRPVGGPQVFIDRLVQSIPKNLLHLNTAISRIEAIERGFLLFAGNEPDRPISAKRIILALPPRIAARQFGNELLEAGIATALTRTPTWMAAQAKTVITYKKAFWRSKGLSGRAASAVGPLVEIHDHHSTEGEYAALFGFVGPPPGRRPTQQLHEAVRQQLIRCFGAKAGSFLHIETRDWAENSLICTSRDREGPASHPQVMPDFLLQPMLNGRLFLAGAETASASPGLIDGALESAERVVSQLLTTR